MNKVILIGNLVRDPEIKTGNIIIAFFTLAVARIKKDEADFINCKAFDKTAELIAKYLKKGSKIAIEGRIQTGSYEKDGKKIYTTDIIVDKVEFLSKNEVKAGLEDRGDDELPF